MDSCSLLKCTRKASYSLCRKCRWHISTNPACTLLLRSILCQPSSEWSHSMTPYYKHSHSIPICIALNYLLGHKCSLYCSTYFNTAVISVHNFKLNAKCTFISLLLALLSRVWLCALLSHHSSNMTPTCPIYMVWFRHTLGLVSLRVVPHIHFHH